MSESSTDRNPFERLAEEFAARLRRGEHPSLTEYVERYPEHADDIRELFPALALVEFNKPAREDQAISFAGPSSSAKREIPERLGDYRILRYLGEGGMGVVYEAVRDSLRCHVALKVMHPQFRTRDKYLRRFRTEARSAARLHHTNIVSVFDYGVHDGVCYYAMQYIAGHSLDKVLADVRQLRGEKAGFRDARATVATGDEGEPEPVERDIPYEAGCKTDPLRQAATLGLLTGRYPSHSPAAVLEESDGSLPLNGSAPAGGAIEDPARIQLLARWLALDTGTTLGNEIGHTETEPFQVEYELGRTQSVAPRASEPPPKLGDARDREHLAPEGSVSSLAGQIDDRYYREVARLGTQIANALAYAHKLGVLHRDIKPPNLILDALGNIWITDFGLAKFEEGDDVSDSHDVVGTLRYMAPERFRGVSSPLCDIYALGATLYQMLTLRPPFEGQDQLELIRRIENGAPVPPRQLDGRIPRDLETIVLKALAKDPNDRFDTAEEMADELQLFLDNRPIALAAHCRTISDSGAGASGIPNWPLRTSPRRS